MANLIVRNAILKELCAFEMIKRSSADVIAGGMAGKGMNTNNMIYDTPLY